MRKGLIKSFAIITACLLILAGCSTDSSTDSKRITLWAGGSDNVRQAFERIANGFNASQDEYTLKVEFILSGTGAASLSDRIIAAKLANQSNTDFDIIELGADEYTKYVSQAGEDIFEKIDLTKIPNSDQLEYETASGSEYLLPYRGTTVLLAYNSEKVTNLPTTSEELYQWIKDNPGRFAYNTPGSGGAGSSFVSTAVYNQLPDEAFISSDEKWMLEWDAGFKLLSELHPFLYQSSNKTIYPNKNQGTLDLLASGEVDMIPAWADQAITSIVNGTLPASTKLTQISPAFTGSLVTLAIPTIGSHSEGAHAVMDYIISQEAQQNLLDQMAAIPVVKLTDKSSDTAQLLDGINITQFRIASLGTLGSKLTEKWDNEIGTLSGQ